MRSRRQAQEIVRSERPSSWGPEPHYSLSAMSAPVQTVVVGPASRPRKSVLAHVFASFMCAGLGSMLAGRVGRGFVIFLFGEVGGLVGVGMLFAVQEKFPAILPGWPNHAQTCLIQSCQDAQVALAGGILLGLSVFLWFIGLFDAAGAVRSYNRSRTTW